MTNVPGLNEAESAEYERRWRAEVIDGSGTGKPIGLLPAPVSETTVDVDGTTEVAG